LPSELEQAYAHCKRVTKQQARNFYYAFRTLPPAKRRAIHAAYAFARHCDDISDEGLPLEEKRTRLSDTHRLLDETASGRSDGPVMLALSDSAQTFHIPYSYFHNLVDGVEMDLTWSRYKDFAELSAYCYKVASVVGLISIEIFGYTDPKAKEYAIDLGLAMQLTNIIRDVKEDAQRGRIYLPQDELRRFGYTEDHLMRGVVNDAFRSLMQYQVQRARSYFQNGRLLIPLLSREARACPAVLHGVYGRILDRVESSGYQVFERRISLSSREKLVLMARLWAQSLMPRVPEFGG